MCRLSVRKQLTDTLTPALPAGWRLVPFQTNLDVLDAPTVMLKQSGIKPAPEAPQGLYVFEYVLTVVTPSTDPETAEADLDDQVETLWGILDGLSWIDPTEAKKVLFQDSGLAYDIRCNILTQKDPS